MSTVEVELINVFHADSFNNIIHRLKAFFNSPNQKEIKKRDKIDFLSNNPGAFLEKS